jgi:epoxyqueuosine reductase
LNIRKHIVNLRVKIARRIVSWVLPDIRKFVPSGTPLIEPSPDSPVGMRVPEVVAIYGQLRLRDILKLLIVSPYALKTMYYSRKSIKSIRRNTKNTKKHVEMDFFSEFEKYARELGISIVGYTRVPRNYIFRNSVLLFENAIVLIMDMKRKSIEKAPSIKTGIEVWRTYAALAKAVYKLSEFMRRKGYNAQPDPPIGGSTNFPLLAQKAGLGWIGKHGLLITETNGPAVRIAAIYTDIELPYTDYQAEKYSWIPEFCKICNRCVRSCPTKAIYPEPKILPNGSRQYIDYKKCAVVFSRTLGCGICIKECPFFRGGFERVKRAYEIIARRKNIS